METLIEPKKQKIDLSHKILNHHSSSCPIFEIFVSIESQKSVLLVLH